MADEFPEKGEFIAPHVARKKPDCDKRPLIPDPCDILPGRRKASVTDFDCVQTPDKIVCPDDFIATYEPDDEATKPPVLPHRSTPAPTPPPTSPAPPTLWGNKVQTASCPSSAEEADDLICTDNDSENFGPDDDGEWPVVGSTIVVPENSFFAETQELADELAAKFACANLECCFGNKAVVGTCTDLVTSNDIEYLNDSEGVDLVRGDDVTIPANVFVNCTSSAEADAEANEALRRVLSQTCYLCSPRLTCPCPSGSEPSEGYVAEECLFQGSVVEITAPELRQRAQEYLDNICECFERPDIADIPDLCVPEINIVNPNTQDCGGEVATGTPTGKQTTDEDCEFDIELPEIPCPCGITLNTFVKNPNRKPQDPSHEASQYFFSDPGGTAGDLTSDLDDCSLNLELTLPEIPLGDIPGPGLGGPCPEGITVEFCVDGKVKRTKPKKWIDPDKNDEDQDEDEENPSCQRRFCKKWVDLSEIHVGQLMAVNVDDVFANTGHDDKSWRCYEAVRTIPPGRTIVPYHTSGWQNYYRLSHKKCGAGGTVCEQSREVEVENVPVDELGYPLSFGNDNDEDPCTVKIPCIDVCSEIGVSNDVVEFTSDGRLIGTVALKKLEKSTGDCKNCPSWAGAGGFVVGEVVSEICPDGKSTCCYEVLQDIPSGFYVRPGFADDAANQGDTADYYRATDIGCDPSGLPVDGYTGGDNDASCVLALDAPNDLDFPVCTMVEASNDTIVCSMNGKKIGDIGLRKISSPIIKQAGTTDSAIDDEGGCTFALVGNNLDFFTNDLCPSTSDDRVKIRLNGEVRGSLGLEAGTKTVNTDSGDYEETSGSCEIKLVGNDIDLNISSNDVDFCPKISDSAYSVDVKGADGTVYGTVTLGVDEDCKLTLTGDVVVPSLYNDDDSPYEEKDIEVCTPSGNETYTILVKKSG